MKTAILIALSLALSCSKKTVRQARLPVKEIYENSLRHTWEQKEVVESMLLSDMEDTTGWSATGIGTISLATDRAKDGARSLRFRTHMRNEEHIKRTAAELGMEQGRNGGSSGVVLNFPHPQDWTKYNRIAVWIYVHPSDIRVNTLTLSFECLGAPTVITTPRSNTVIQGLKQGEWNFVTWEIPNLHRNKVSRFSISQGTRGHDPGLEGIVTYDFDKLELQVVDADMFEGWEVEEGKIAFSHVGYAPWQSKTAIATDLSASQFELVDALTQKVILTKPVETVSNNLGKFLVLNFSEITSQGKYFIRAGEMATRPFIIADSIWKQPIIKAINFFYCERCGTDIPGIHGECHKDWRGSHDGDTALIYGGWHDAGDLTQSFYRTGMTVYSMLQIVEQLKLRETDPELEALVLEEALWGLDWILKSRFRNGYRVSSSMMRIYTDGIIGTDDDVITPAKNLAWESFLGSGITALAYLSIKNNQPELAKKCLMAAEEDWEAAVHLQPEWEKFENPAFLIHPREGNAYLAASWGIVASLHLFEATGKTVYSDRAIEYGRRLLSMQERKFIDGIPITGYFYTGPGKTSINYYSHAGFEEIPLLAFRDLCEAFPDHEEWMDWFGASVIHSEYFMKRGAAYSAPYHMLPAAVYRKSDFNRVADTVTKEGMLKQFYEGMRFTDEYYLRRFPVWTNIGFHGQTGVQLSETLALTASSLLRNDPESEELASKQMQWVFGRNPFSQSLMYGEGYDFAPLYGPNPGDIVGALPVGVDCMNNDAPYWDGTNIWTYKEIWVLPVNRFLWEMAYLGMPGHIRGNIINGKTDSLLFRNHSTGVNRSVSVSADGSFQTVLQPGEYTMDFANSSRKLTVVSGNNYQLSLDPANTVELTASLKNQKPGQKNFQVEIVGEGKGKHETGIRAFNAKVSGTGKSIDLGDGSKETMVWDVEVIDQKTPWVIVIIPDGDLTLKKELTGTMEIR